MIAYASQIQWVRVCGGFDRGVGKVKRPGSFAFSGVPVAPWKPQQAMAEAAQPRSLGGPAAGRSNPQDPIRELLQSLRGREVVLQVGDRLVVGKLITHDPVLLVDQEGRSTLVRFEAIQAVTF